MRFFGNQNRPVEERLLWSRDIRFVNRLAKTLALARVIELDSGSCLIAPADELTDTAAAEVARTAHDPAYGVVTVDLALPEGDRYVLALSTAVQVSGLADRIGMAQSTQVVQTKTLDYFFNLKANHEVHFQPIVELATGELNEYECLFRPVMPMLPQSITAIVQAAIDTDRSIELDAFILGRTLDRVSGIVVARDAAGLPPLRIAINMTPASLIDPRFQPRAFAKRVRSVGLSPRQVTLEVTEQQAVSDVLPLKRQVKALRRLGFGFAVDDAGAGYASFNLIAALRPSIIKIDRQIVRGIHRDDAKQALVEAFVSFGRRIGARLLAEGIETRNDLEMLRALGVELGQGFLFGRSAAQPAKPRRVETLAQTAVRKRSQAAALAGAVAASSTLVVD